MKKFYTCYKTVLFIAVSFTLSSCSTSQKASTNNTTNATTVLNPKLANAMQLEANNLPLSTIKSKDGIISFDIKSTSPNTEVTFENDQYLYLGNYDKVEYNCSVETKQIPAANLSKTLQEIVDSTIAKNGLKIERSIYSDTDVNVVHGRPYLKLYRNIVVGKALGSVTTYVGYADGYTLSCLFQGLGYKNTKTSIFESFLASFKTSKQQKKPTKVTVFKLTMNGKTVGFSFDEMFEKDDTVLDIEATIMQRSPGDIVASDATTISKAATDGLLGYAEFHSVENNKQKYYIKLERTSIKNTYLAKGDYQGKDFEASIFAEHTINGPNKEASEYKSLYQNSKKSTPITSSSYDPGVDPSKVLTGTSKFIKNLRKGDKAFELDIKDIMKVQFIGDKNSIKQVDVDMGSVKIKTTRIYEK